MKFFAKSLLLLDIVCAWDYNAKNNEFFSPGGVRVVNATRIEVANMTEEKNVRDYDRFRRTNEQNAYNIPIILALDNGYSVRLGSGIRCEEKECASIQSFSVANILLYCEQFIDDVWSSELVWAKFIHLAETVAVLVLIFNGVKWWTSRQLKK
jgi:hypothetical protein